MTLARFAGVAIDHARRYTGAAARGDELARTVAALEATTEIARVVAGATDLEVILDAGCQARTGARLGTGAADRARRRKRAGRRRSGRRAPRWSDRAADSRWLTRSPARRCEPAPRSAWRSICTALALTGRTVPARRAPRPAWSSRSSFTTRPTASSSPWTGSITDRRSPLRTSGCWRRSRPARPRQSRPPARRRPSCNASASRPRKPSAGAGRVSCTTKPCRASPRPARQLVNGSATGWSAGARRSRR